MNPWLEGYVTGILNALLTVAVVAATLVLGRTAVRVLSRVLS